MPIYKLAAAAKRLLRGESTDPRALANISKILEERPLDINVETTNFCPLRCVFCPNRQHPRTKALMSMELFERICRDFYDIGGGAIGICSMQSDIFSDDLLDARLAVLERYKDRFHVHTTTNLVGAKRLTDAQLEKFLRTFDHLEVSIGGLSREEYRTLYGADAFETVKGELLRIAAMVRAKRIPISLDLSIRTNNMMKLRLAKLFHHGLLTELKKSYTIFNSRNVFFSWGGLISQSDLPGGAKIRIADNSAVRIDCVVPWSTLSINTDGLVIGCGCVDWEARHLVGDMTKETISGTWHSEAALAFRTSFSRGDIPALCRECSHYCPKDAAFSKPELADYAVTDGLHYKQQKKSAR